MTLQYSILHMDIFHKQIRFVLSLHYLQLICARSSFHMERHSVNVQLFEVNSSKSHLTVFTHSNVNKHAFMGFLWNFVWNCHSIDLKKKHYYSVILIKSPTCWSHCSCQGKSGVWLDHIAKLLSKTQNLKWLKGEGK